MGRYKVERVALSSAGFKKMRKTVKGKETRIYEIQLGPKRVDPSLDRILFMPERYEKQYGETIHGHIVDRDGNKLLRAMIMRRGAQIKDTYTRRLLLGGTEIARGTWGEDDIILSILPENAAKTTAEKVANYRNEKVVVHLLTKLLSKEKRAKLGPLYIENVNGWVYDIPELPKTMIGKIVEVLKGKVPPSFIVATKFLETIGPYEEEVPYRWAFWKEIKQQEMQRVSRISQMASKRIRNNIVKKLEWIDRMPLSDLEMLAAPINIAEARLGALKAFAYGYRKNVIEQAYGKAHSTVTWPAIQKAEQTVKSILGEEDEKLRKSILRIGAGVGAIGGIYTYTRLLRDAKDTTIRYLGPVTSNATDLMNQGRGISPKIATAAVLLATVGATITIKTWNRILETLAYRRARRALRSKQLNEEELNTLARNAKILINSPDPKHKGTARAILEFANKKNPEY